MTITTTFNPTGTLQTFTVPVGITSLTIEALGAGTTNSRGGRAIRTLAVAPGQVLNIYVGSTSGYGGGGARGNMTTVGVVGCGASSVLSSDETVVHIVAGGGGGQGGQTTGTNYGGHGGGPTGAPGGSVDAGVTGGGGGGQAGDAAGGLGNPATINGLPAVGRVGGNGGGTGVGVTGRGGGGGGGGYRGGGGGGGRTGTTVGGAGGGGGSNGPTAALTTDTQGYQTGQGQVIITHGDTSPKVFTYTGGEQTFVVPAGVSSLTIDAYGAQGEGYNYAASSYGQGGRAVGTFAVTPGQTLYVNVGGKANSINGGFNGGGSNTGSWAGSGGGGASDVRTTSGNLTTRLLAAGGGGGGGSSTSPPGGYGGGSTGAAGINGAGPGQGGGGGTQLAGGTRGSTSATVGALGVGGTGDGTPNFGGGAGGGGWYGGGGGGNGSSSSGSGGGGGSNGPAASLTTNTQGGKTGDGQITLTWVAATPVAPATVATTWRVRASITPADVLTNWRVLVGVSSAAVASLWKVRAELAAISAATAWAVAGNTTPVVASQSTNWALAGRVMQEAGTTWSTSSRVEATASPTTWKVQQGTGRTVATTWATRQAVARTTTTTWAIYERAFLVGEYFLVQIETTPGMWHDVTGDGHRIDTSRHAGEPGTLTYEVLNADLDPVTTSAISMGDGLRVLVKKAATWVAVFTGQINDLGVELDPRAEAGRQVNVTMSATDNVAALSNITEARGVETVDELRWLVGSTVPFIINGSSAPLAGGTVVATNENASLWDQILVTRDSALGFAWVDGDNALRVYDAAAIDTGLKASITPAVYSDLNRDFTLDEVINEVTVNWRRYNVGTETSTDVPYGPYVDGPSRAKWGPRSASFTIQGPAVEEDEATISAYASGVLARNSEASHRAKSAAIPVNTASRLALVRDLDLNHLVSVVYQDGVTVATLRVVGISHSVSNRAGEGTVWTTTFDFASTDAIAPPSQTPGTGVPYVPPGSIGDDELDGGVTDSIADAAEQAAAALADAEEAFNLASEAATTVDGWKYTGTTKIDGGDIQTDTIGAVQIGANAITAKHTLTGPLIQTTATANRGVKLNSTGLFAWDAGGGATFNIDAGTGAAVFKGSILSGSTITGAAIVGTTSITGANILTAASPNPRVVIGPLAGVNAIAYYPDAGAAGSSILFGDGSIIIGANNVVTFTGKVSTGELTGGPLISGGPRLAGGVVLEGIPTLSAAQFASGANQDLRVTGAGAFTTSTSSVRAKEQLRELADVVDVADVYGLRPLAFKFKDREAWGDRDYAGVIAEEADEGGLGIFTRYDADGQPAGFDYDFFTAGLLLTVRDLNRRVASLEAQLQGGTDE